MTSPLERVVQKGFEDKVPRTPQDFARIWKESTTYTNLRAEIDAYNARYTPGGQDLQRFKDSRRAQQSTYQRVSSPYTLSYAGQVNLCLQRGFWRLKGDPTLTYTQLGGNFIMTLIISSIFYNLPQTTDSFFSRSAVLFFALLLNAFGSALEVRQNQLFSRILLTPYRRSSRSTPNAQSWRNTHDMLCTILPARLWRLCSPICRTRS